MTNWIIWLLPLPPLLAFFAIILFTNKNKALSHGIAIGAAGLSWLGSMVVFIYSRGNERIWQACFRVGDQLAADRRDLAPGWRAGRSALGGGVVLCGLDGAGDFRLQRRLP